MATARFGLCLYATAQQPAVRPGVSVLLTDPSNAAIPNAAMSIFVADHTTGAPLREVRTDPSGRVAIPLPAGNYLLQSEAPGEPSAELGIAASAEEFTDPSDDAAISNFNGHALVLSGITLSTLFDDPSTF